MIGFIHMNSSILWMFVAFTHIYPPSAAICLALFHFGERLAYAMWAVGIGHFFVATVIVVASVQACEEKEQRKWKQYGQRFKCPAKLKLVSALGKEHPDPCSFTRAVSWLGGHHV